MKFIVHFRFQAVILADRSKQILLERPTVIVRERHLVVIPVTHGAMVPLEARLLLIRWAIRA